MFYKKLKDLFLKNSYCFLFLVIVLFFFRPVFIGKIPFPGDLLINENPYKTLESYPNKAQGADVIKEIYPWRFFSINQIKNGDIPFWNPHNFSGNPQLANFQTAIFYPFNILYFIFSFNTAWTIIIMLQPFLAAIFMYLFLSKGLLLKKFTSFIGGIVFAFSSYMIVWLEYGNIGSTLLWLPLALLFTKWILDKPSIFNFLSLTFTLTFSILAGYIQGVFYIYVLCFFYFLFLLVFERKKKIKIRNISIFLISIILPIFLSAFQFLPTYKLFLNSTRGSYSISQISNLLLPSFYWITAFASDFFGNPATRNYWISGTYIERVMYVGVPIIFFAFYGVSKSKILEKRFFLVLGTLSLILATNLPLVKFFYLIPLPVISTTVPTRELSIFIFSLIVLSSMGIDYWLINKENKSKISIIFLLIYVAIWLAVIILSKLGPVNYQYLQITRHNLILPSFLAIATIIVFYLKRKAKTLGLIFLTLIVILDLLYFFNKITPFSPTTFVYPKTSVVSFLQKNAGINRFWGYGSAYIPANFQTIDGTYSPEGNDPLHIESYGQLLASSAKGTLPNVLPRPDANIVPGFGTNDLKNNYYRQRIINLLGVKYILNKNDSLLKEYVPDYDTFAQNYYKLVWQDSPWQIYENKNALPRFFMTGSYVIIKDKNSVISAIYNKNLDLQKTLILEEKPSMSIDGDSLGIAKLLSYTPNKVSFSTKSNGNSLLFLSDNYWDEWQALIDNKPVKTYIADYSFRAVEVPKGQHTFVFSYNPASFFLGLKISSISLLILILIPLWIKKYGKEI